MGELMDCRANFSTYRQFLKSNDLPCLPYFGVFLRDFTFIDVGNRDSLEDGTANYEKMQMIATVMKDFRKYQAVQYLFPVSPEIRNYLLNISSLEENSLFKFSTNCESPSEI